MFEMKIMSLFYFYYCFLIWSQDTAEVRPVFLHIASTWVPAAFLKLKVFLVTPKLCLEVISLSSQSKAIQV